MKVSIDNILGTARKINSQRQLEEENLGKRKKEVKSDSVSISTRVNSRLDGIEREFREIQSSLTRNQIIRDGIDQLKADYGRGGENQSAIFDAVKFEGNKVLRAYVGENPTGDTLKIKADSISNDINSNVDRIKRLQVELDNIMASNLAGNDKAENILAAVDRAFDESDGANLEKISQIRPDAVIRLIK